MKLLYITNGINGAGGLERVLSVKASYLADVMGYHVHILRLNEGDVSPFYTFSPQIVLHSIKVGGNPIQYSYEYISGIKRVIKEINPDLLSVCDDGLKAFFLPLVLGSRIPIVYERHASINLNFGNQSGSLLLNFRFKISYFLMKLLASTFDSFVVLTKGNLKEWNSTNLKVIGNPLSFYPKGSASLNEKTVVAVGSHSYNKGYDLLLEAWVLVTNKFPDWKLSIYGKIDSNRTYLKLANELHLTKSVLFFDPVANIQSTYLNSSILVLPSRSEGFGMVLIEGMACGLPCVAYDCPHGPADIIMEAVDGILVENGDVAGLSNALIRLIENEKLRKEMGATAKGNVQRFLPETILPLWDSLFKQLIH